jgi:hypothetical protein
VRAAGDLIKFRIVRSQCLGTSVPHATTSHICSPDNKIGEIVDHALRKWLLGALNKKLRRRCIRVSVAFVYCGGSAAAA